MSAAIPQEPVASHLAEPKAQKLVYTNWRGETAQREIRPTALWFGSTEWHPEPQWFVRATDLDRGATRDFALSGFASPAQGATAPSEEDEPLPEGWEGSADAMVWAKAYRHFVLKNNLTMSDAIDPGYMVGWFANYWAAITRDRLPPSEEDDLRAAELACDLCGITPHSDERISARQAALIALRNSRAKGAA